MKLVNFLLPAAVALIILSAFGCGRKSPPFLPEKDFPYTVMQLQVERETGNIALKGTVSSINGRGTDRAEIKGCRIYHAWYAPYDSPCEGCPVNYSVYQDVEGEFITEGGFYCRIPMEAKKGIHFFKVSLISRNSAVGPPSNQARFAVDD